MTSMRSSSTRPVLVTPCTGDRNFPGFRRAYAHDPFDNQLGFLEPSPIDAGLNARLAESGGLRLLREV